MVKLGTRIVGVECIVIVPANVAPVISNKRSIGSIEAEHPFCSLEEMWCRPAKEEELPIRWDKKELPVHLRHVDPGFPQGEWMYFPSDSELYLLVLSWLSKRDVPMKFNGASEVLWAGVLAVAGQPLAETRLACSISDGQP